MKSKIYLSEIYDVDDCPFMGVDTVVCESCWKNIPEATHICSCEWSRKEKEKYAEWIFVIKSISKER